MSWRSATLQAVVDRRRGAAPVLVQLQADGAGEYLPSSGSGRLALPLPVKPMFIGKASAAWSIRAMCQGPEAGGGVDPGGGAGAAADHGGDPLISASSICCGQMKRMCVDAAGGEDHALAGDHLVPAPMAMFTPG